MIDEGNKWQWKAERSVLYKNYKGYENKGNDTKLQRVVNEISQKSNNHLVDFDLNSKFLFGNFTLIRNTMVVKIRHKFRIYLLSFSSEAGYSTELML